MSAADQPKSLAPGSLAEVFARYRRDRLDDELRTDWAHAVFYRPASLIAAFLLARTPVTPMAVTLAGGLSIPAMAAAALLLDAAVAVPVVAVLAYLGGLVDCVDGDLARQTGRTSRLGAYVDFQIDMVRWAALYVAAGLAADRATETEWAWAAVGATAAWLRIFARSGRDFRAADAVGAAVAPPPPARLGPFDVFVAAIAGLDGAIPLVLLVGWILGAGGAILLVPFALAVLDVADTQRSNLAHFGR